MIAKICYQQLDKFLVISYDYVHFDDFRDTAVLICSSISIITGDQEW